MSIASTILRAVTGAFILNSGWNKKDLPAEAAGGLQEMAATGIPQLKDMDADTFGKFISYSEMGVGAALLAPFVSNRLAGAALTTFGSGLLTMYFGNDDMTESDGIRPSQEGTALAKDSWLVAIGAALLLWPNDKARAKKAEKRAKKAEKKAEKAVKAAK